MLCRNRSPLSSQQDTILPFVGIILDTVRYEARLPTDKLDHCKSPLDTFMGCNKITLKELQSLIGILSFACTVIVPGRAILR